MSQEENAQNHKSTLVPGFGQRFLTAFGDLKQSEIATLLNVQPSAITNYTKDRVPKPHILVKIWEHTNCDLHWLLTGEHLPSPSPPVPLENGEQKIVENLAQTTNQTVDQVLRELLIEALKHRGLIKPRPYPAMIVFRPDIKVVAIPLIGSISAGQPIKYFKEHRTVMVAEIFIPHDGYQFCVLEIVGNDVDEGLASGDYIICCNNTQPESGQVVVAQIDGATPTVKRIFFEGANVRLQPINNKSPSDPYPAEKVKIIYTVTGVQHNP